MRETHRLERTHAPRRAGKSSRLSNAAAAVPTPQLRLRGHSGNARLNFSGRHSCAMHTHTHIRTSRNMRSACARIALPLPPHPAMRAAPTRARPAPRCTLAGTRQRRRRRTSLAHRPERTRPQRAAQDKSAHGSTAATVVTQQQQRGTLPRRRTEMRETCGEHTNRTSACLGARDASQ